MPTKQPTSIDLLKDLAGRTPTYAGGRKPGMVAWYYPDGARAIETNGDTLWDNGDAKDFDALWDKTAWVQLRNDATGELAPAHRLGVDGDGAALYQGVGGWSPTVSYTQFADGTWTVSQ